MITERENDLAMLARSLKVTTRRLDQRPDDMWEVDAPFYDLRQRGGHDYYFAPLLKAVGVRDFKELGEMRAWAETPTDMLELFGSGFFTADYLDRVDSVTGVRLIDSSQELVKQLAEDATNDDNSNQKITEDRAKAIRRIETVTSSPKWNLVTGNIYLPQTWNTLDTQNTSRGIKEYGVIVAKPEGAFFIDEIFDDDDLFGSEKKDEQRLRTYSPKFLRLLSRAYDRLSPQHGMLFTEVPGFMARTQLDPFVNLLNEKGNVKAVTTQESDYYGDDRRNLLIVKRPNSVANLEQFAHSHFNQAR